MANPAIKFKRVATFAKTGLEKGTIYFEHNTGNIYIATGESTYDVYGLGLKEASWNGKVLTLRQSGADDIILDFSNVASKSALDTVSADLTKLAGKVSTNETDITNLKAADVTIQGNIDTVSGNLAKEIKDRTDAVAGVQGSLDTLSATVTTLNGTVIALDGTVAANKADIEKTVGDLTATVTSNKEAADATQTELTNYKSTNEAALGVIREDISDLEDAVSNAQKAATTTLTEVDPAFGIKVAKTTETDGHLNYTITGVDLAKGSDLTALDARVEANEGAIEIINGTGDGSIKKAVADLKQEILIGDTNGEIKTAYDTIVEISNWIADHQESDYADLVNRMGTAEADIDALQEKVDIEKKVSEYVADEIGKLDNAVTSTDGQNVQVKVTEENGVITAVNITTDNTVNKDTYASDKSDLEASIATAKKAGDDAQADLNAFKTTVSDTYATKVTVSGIDTRLTTAEGDIDDLEAFQTTASADIATLKADVVKAQGAADKAQGDVDALGTEVAKLKNLSGDYATKAELDITNGNVATNTAAIATLNGDVNTDGSVAKAIADALLWKEFD